MIEPKGVIDLPGTPAAIREAADVPWHLAGFVHNDCHHTIRACCLPCLYEEEYDDSATVPVVQLTAHTFMVHGLMDHLWFGRCDRCGRALYAIRENSRIWKEPHEGKE